MWCIGIDEAGRGPVIGPLVVAALALPEADVPLLVEAGVTDSKLLSEERRTALASWIQETAEARGWHIAIHRSEPADIDLAMSTSSLNAHEVELFARLAQQVRPEAAGVIQLDACDADERRFGNLVAGRLKQWPWEGWTIDSRHGADLHLPAVGGASILAKVCRDSAVEAIAADLEMELGSGYPSDPKTIAALPQLLEGRAPHTCLRWRWKTVVRAWQESHGCDPPPRSGGTAVGQSTLDLF